VRFSSSRVVVHEYVLVNVCCEQSMYACLRVWPWQGWVRGRRV
jgi:hypothetical protein